jgi:hypothetical protein
MPYARSPLGEGSGRDPDPRFRLDRFDCVTFVETALALGASRRVDEARILLDDIRYSGQVDFEHRNHYVETQWLPSLASKRWAEDVTASVADGRSQQVVEHHSLERWRRSHALGQVVRGLSPETLPVGDFALSFVPLADVPSIAARIPHGTIVLVVREARADRPYRVTHMGIVSTDGGEPVLRHASPGKGRVVDEPLDAFVARLRGYRAWPVSGLGFWSIRDNETRARAILERARSR